MSDQSYSYTQRARDILSRAQAEAERQGHSEIDTEHLMLAILRDKDGVASEFLKILELDPEKISNMQDVTSSLNRTSGRAELLLPLIFDISAPIRAIERWAELVKSNIQVDEEEQRIVDQIVSQIKRLRNVRDQALDQSRTLDQMDKGS